MRGSLSGGFQRTLRWVLNREEWSLADLITKLVGRFRVAQCLGFFNGTAINLLWASCPSPSSPIAATMIVPTEIIEKITLCLPPIEGYRVAVALRLIQVRDIIMMQGGVRLRGMDVASSRNLIGLLEWWKDGILKLKYVHRQKPLYTEGALSGATYFGHVEVLQWWKASGLALIHGDVLDVARNVEVLQWWKHSGLQFGYSTIAMDEAEDVSVLQWWKDSGLDLRYSKNAINTAADCGWRDSGRGLRSTGTINAAAYRGEDVIKLLNWWKESGLPLKYTEQAVDEASAAGNIELLQWWKESGLEMRYSEKAMDRAKVASLQWWKDSGLVLKYSTYSMDEASLRDKLEVLQWWKDSGLALKYSVKAMNMASVRGKVETLQWWKDSGLPLKFSEDSLYLALRLATHDCTVVTKERWDDLSDTYGSFYKTGIQSGARGLDWWKRSGLHLPGMRL